MTTDADTTAEIAGAARAETHTFQAEVAQLLHLMVHSVYSETDIFLRELISNASDACDKLRYEAIARPELMAGDLPLAIRITPDAKAGTLTVTDTGIGMDRQELIDNLGTIARSGTRAFMQRLAETQAAKAEAKANGGEGGGLIGQFGVGFYSAFMVADRIEVVSRRAGANEAWAWSSSSGAGFDMAPASAEQAARVARGTAIVLHLKADARRYLEPYQLERIVHTWSDHVQFPIELDDSRAADPGAKLDDGQPDDPKVRQINTASAIWQRSKSELTADDHAKAYRAITGGFDEPAMTLHYKAEGRQSYAVLLYAPSAAPFDLFDPARKGRVKLYVRRVFITDDAELLPPYLRFVRGVIDSEDLPLNLSREVLQNNPLVAQIRKAVTTRVIGELESVAEKEPAQFAKIWTAFGAVLKEGLYEDFERRDKLLALARFETTATAVGGDDAAAKMRTLKQYVADLKPKQQAIYYLCGETAERMRASPKLEAARARGVEVLLLPDHVDAFWTSMPFEFEGHKLQSLSQGDVDFGDIPLIETAPAETPAAPSAAVDDAVVIAAVKVALGDRVSDVRASRRLTDSPSCLVAGGSGPDRELERLLARSRPGAQGAGSAAKPILELNMRHALVGAVADARAGGRETDVSDIAAVLLDQARILDGELPDEPTAFAARLNRLIVRGLGKSGTTA